MKAQCKTITPENEDSGLPDRIPWHPAFVEALQLELAMYKDALDFLAEEELTSEPLKIDMVIIKKIKDIKIEKNFARIFKGHNLVEYKSPGDYVSVGDFYKVYGYACLYSYLKKVPITDITLTFVESRRPRELVSHLRKTRKFTIEEKPPGIYTINGDIIPLQILDSRKLSGDENLWLKSLSGKLDAAAADQVLSEIERLGKAARAGAYLYAVTRSNLKILEEAAKMSCDALTFERALEKYGWADKWMAKGEARGKALGEARGKVEGRKTGQREVITLLKSGKTIEETEQLLGLC